MLNEALAGQGQVYFVDAAHFVYGAFLAVVWCFCRTFIKTPSGRQRLNVLGALNAVTHQFVSVVNQAYVNAQSVCDLLDKLRALHPGDTLTLVLDNARYQHCKMVLDHAATRGIRLLFLPPYSPKSILSISDVDHRQECLCHLDCPERMTVSVSGCGTDILVCGGVGCHHRLGPSGSSEETP